MKGVGRIAAVATACSAALAVAPAGAGATHCNTLVDCTTGRVLSQHAVCVVQGRWRGTWATAATVEGSASGRVDCASRNGSQPSTGTPVGSGTLTISGAVVNRALTGTGADGLLSAKIDLIWGSVTITVGGDTYVVAPLSSYGGPGGVAAYLGSFSYNGGTHGGSATGALHLVPTFDGANDYFIDGALALMLGG